MPLNPEGNLQAKEIKMKGPNKILAALIASTLFLLEPGMGAYGAFAQSIAGKPAMGQTIPAGQLSAPLGGQTMRSSIQPTDSPTAATQLPGVAAILPTPSEPNAEVPQAALEELPANLSAAAATVVQPSSDKDVPLEEQSQRSKALFERAGEKRELTQLAENAVPNEAASRSVAITLSPAGSPVVKDRPSLQEGIKTGSGLKQKEPVATSPWLLALYGATALISVAILIGSTSPLATSVALCVLVATAVAVATTAKLEKLPDPHPVAKNVSKPAPIELTHPISRQQAADLIEHLGKEGFLAKMDIEDPIQRSWLAPMVDYVELAKDGAYFNADPENPYPDALHSASYGVKNEMERLEKAASVEKSPEALADIARAMANLEPALHLYVGEKEISEFRAALAAAAPKKANQIETLVSQGLMTQEAVNKLRRLDITSIEEFLVRVEDGPERESLAAYLGINEQILLAAKAGAEKLTAWRPGPPRKVAFGAIRKAEAPDAEADQAVMKDQEEMQAFGDAILAQVSESLKEKMSAPTSLSTGEYFASKLWTLDASDLARYRAALAASEITHILSVILSSKRGQKNSIQVSLEQVTIEAAPSRAVPIDYLIARISAHAEVDPTVAAALWKAAFQTILAGRSLPGIRVDSRNADSFHASLRPFRSSSESGSAKISAVIVIALLAGLMAGATALARSSAGGGSWLGVAGMALFALAAVALHPSTLEIIRLKIEERRFWHRHAITDQFKPINEKYEAELRKQNPRVMRVLSYPVTAQAVDGPWEIGVYFWTLEEMNKAVLPETVEGRTPAERLSVRKKLHQDSFDADLDKIYGHIRR